MTQEPSTGEEEAQRIVELEREVARLKRALRENEQRYRLIMGRYVTSEVMEQLLASSDATIVGERREITMMFTDLRGSTELAESMEPEAYLRMLNHYLKDMILILDGWQGNILAFVGDAIVCVFGAPQENLGAARAAVYSAVAMQRRMTKINEWNLSHGYPNLQMGIGIHTGEAIAGCIGSEARMKYDVIGRSMNLASRVEGFAQGGQILVTDATLVAAGDGVVVREEDVMTVHPKGIRGGVRVHDVIGMGKLRIP